MDMHDTVREAGQWRTRAHGRRSSGEKVEGARLAPTGKAKVKEILAWKAKVAAAPFGPLKAKHNCL